MIQFNNVFYKYHEEDNFVFSNLNIEIPEGITSLVGQNGTGKTTFLLLSAGLLIPEQGDVIILTSNTKQIKTAQSRQQIVSFIYQNMEFESEDSINSLLKIVYANGFHTTKTDTFIKELIDVFELSSFLNRRTQEISKGELQRVIIAFSLLFGSKLLIMDEPIFALEDYQKKKTMNYLRDYSIKNKISIVYSAHELDITKQYSDNVCFFHKNKVPEIGKTDTIFIESKLEDVFNIPFPMLKQKEYLYRESLVQTDLY